MTMSTSNPAGGEPGASSVQAALEEGRRQFLALVAHIRPELHRYCARMTGSLADGEDVVQDTLARAYYQFPEQKELPPLRPWLFRIAHNLAVDHYRRASYRLTEPLDDVLDLADDRLREPDSALARQQAVHLALRGFLQLAPAQRACVILKDVLEHSLEEIGEELDLTVPAVKSALSRGRALLAQQGRDAAVPEAPPRQVSPELQRFTALFNARDWDGLRAMLADDVRMDVVSRSKGAGRRVVGAYFGNYERLADWHMAPAWLDGREVVAVYAAAGDAQARYFVEVRFDPQGKVSTIQDFFFVPYILQEAVLQPLPGPY
jgi:RNA polymerase sigma-70 factor (ECF subfamily)